jgi:hypothetical protein
MSEQLKFGDRVLEQYGVRLVTSDSQFLMPIYNCFDQLIDIIELNATDTDGAIQKHGFVGLQVTRNRRNQAAQRPPSDTQSQHETNLTNNDTLYITDSILNAFTLMQSTDCPAIVVNSDECSIEVVEKLKLSLNNLTIYCETSL